MERADESRTFHRTGPDAAGGIYLLRPVLAVFAAVIVLYAAFEVVEQIWLNDVDPALLRTLHRVRGGIAALMTAGLATWAIVREGPPLLAAGPLADEHEADGPTDSARKRLHHARWFILMRWIAIVVATVAVLGAVEVAELLPEFVGPSLGALIALLTLLNVGYTLHLRQAGAGPGFLALQVYADLVVLILLLHFSGGIENPLTPLLLLHVIIAGIVLGRRQAYLVAGVASVLFALLGWAECVGVLPHYTLRLFPHVHVNNIMFHAAHDPLYATSRVVLQAVILLLVAYFTTTLVERIRQDERQLAGLADRALAQNQTLERALDTTGTALCLSDSSLQTSWSNNRWTDWLATAPALGVALDPAGSPAAGTLRDGAVRTTHIRTGSPDGDEGGGRVFHVTTAPLRDRDGTIRQVATLARDVTDAHEAQARALRAERLAAVGELAGQIAHEVNNPIAIISAKARLLLRDGGAGNGARPALPEKAAREIVRITELSDRVARIAQGLLSYCRPAPGVRTPLDVRTPLRRALAYVDARAGDARVHIRDELPHRPPFVLANAAELEQVFLNLLLNALDAMPDGGTLRLTAWMERAPAAAGDVLGVQVADSGSGIPTELQHRVFEPFLTTKGGRGTGLGLSICQGIVRSHGGDIAIESEPGVGTRVTVRLPVVAPAATSMAMDREGACAHG